MLLRQGHGIEENAPCRIGSVSVQKTRYNKLKEDKHSVEPFSMVPLTLALSHSSKTSLGDALKIKFPRFSRAQYELFASKTKSPANQHFHLVEVTKDNYRTMEFKTGPLGVGKTKDSEETARIVAGWLMILLFMRTIRIHFETNRAVRRPEFIENSWRAYQSVDVLEGAVSTLIHENFNGKEFGSMLGRMGSENKGTLITSQLTKDFGFDFAQARGQITPWNAFDWHHRIKNVPEYRNALRLIELQAPVKDKNSVSGIHKLWEEEFKRKGRRIIFESSWSTTGTKDRFCFWCLRQFLR